MWKCESSIIVPTVRGMDISHTVIQTIFMFDRSLIRRTDKQLVVWLWLIGFRHPWEEPSRVHLTWRVSLFKLLTTRSLLQAKSLFFFYFFFFFFIFFSSISCVCVCVCCVLGAVDGQPRRLRSALHDRSNKEWSNTCRLLCQPICLWVWRVFTYLGLVCEPRKMEIRPVKRRCIPVTRPFVFQMGYQLVEKEIKEKKNGRFSALRSSS